MYDIREDQDEDIGRKFNDTYIGIVSNGEPIVFYIDRFYGRERKDDGMYVVFRGHAIDQKGGEESTSRSMCSVLEESFDYTLPPFGYVRSVNTVWNTSQRPSRRWRLGFSMRDAQIVEVQGNLRNRYRFKPVSTDSGRFIYDLFYPEYPADAVDLVLSGKKHAVPISKKLCIALSRTHGAPVLYYHGRMIGWWDRDDKLHIFDEIDWLVPYIRSKGVNV